MNTEGCSEVFRPKWVMLKEQGMLCSCDVCHGWTGESNATYSDSSSHDIWQLNVQVRLIADYTPFGDSLSFILSSKWG